MSAQEFDQRLDGILLTVIWIQLQLRRRPRRRARYVELQARLHRERRELLRLVEEANP